MEARGQKVNLIIDSIELESWMESEASLGLLLLSSMSSTQSCACNLACVLESMIYIKGSVEFGDFCFRLVATKVVRAGSGFLLLFFLFSLTSFSPSSFSFIFSLFYPTFRDSLAKKSNSVLNGKASCHHFPNAGITAMCHHEKQDSINPYTVVNFI